MGDTELIQALLLIIRNADAVTRNNIIDYILSSIPPESLVNVADYVTSIA